MRKIIIIILLTFLNLFGLAHSFVSTAEEKDNGVYIFNSSPLAPNPPPAPSFPAFPAGAIFAIDAYYDSAIYSNLMAVPTIDIGNASPVTTNYFVQTTAASQGLYLVPTDNYYMYFFDGSNDYYYPRVNIAKPANISIVFYGRSLSKSVTGQLVTWAKADATAYWTGIQFNNDDRITMAFNQSSAGNSQYYRTRTADKAHTTTPSMHILTQSGLNAPDYVFNGKCLALDFGKTGTPLAVSNEQMAVGRQGAKGSYYLRGNIGVLYIYNRKLTSAEVTQSILAIEARSGSL